MRRNQKGILFIAVAAILWSLQGVLGKTNTWGSFSLVGVRAVFASITLGLTRKDFRFPTEKKDWLSGTFVALTALFFLVSNNLTTAANCIILQYTMPLFVMLVGVLFFKKKPAKSEILVSMFVLIGIFLCVSGNFGNGNRIGDILALISAVTYAGVFTAGGLLHADARNYTYAGNLLCVLFLSAIPFDKNFTWSLSGFATASAMGLTVGMGYACFSRGMKEGVAPVSAAIVSNLEPVFNPVWVLLFLGEKPSIVSFIGFIVVLTSVTLYGMREGKTNSEKSA